VSDQYVSARSLPFPALAAALGLDINNYRQRQHGKEWYGPCPIHNPKQNSTSFSYAADGKFHCFSCEAKGRGGIDLVKLVKNLGFKEAVEFLGSVPPAAIQNEPIVAPVASEGVLAPLAKDTWRKFAVPCPWLEQRIPDAGIREKYGVFAYNNPARKSAYCGRVMLPVKDAQGQLYGYLGRLWSDKPSENNEDKPPKHLFPKNLPKSRFPFGAAEVAAGTFGQAPLRVLYCVESPFAVMHFASLGLPGRGDVWMVDIR
jgi:DNA primase